MPTATATKLDSATIEIRPFSTETVVNRFGCGKRPIDQFLKNKAKKATNRFEHKVFCAHRPGSHIAIGYYALQIGSDSVNELPKKNKDNYLKMYIAFPAVNLTFLGVSTEFQRQGLGSYLLMDAFSKVATISDYAGFYALTLQSYGDESTKFYNSLNFTIYSENISQPKMLYPLEDILTLVRGRP